MTHPGENAHLVSALRRTLDDAIPKFGRKAVERLIAALILAAGTDPRTLTAELRAVVARFVAGLSTTSSEPEAIREAVAEHFERTPIPPALIDAVQQILTDSMKEGVDAATVERWRSFLGARAPSTDSDSNDGVRAGPAARFQLADRLKDRK